jgi:hypothetical protein
MYKKIVCHYFFIFDKKNSLAVVSNSKEKLLSYQESLSSNLNISEIESLVSINHKKIKEFLNPLNEDGFLIKIDYVGTKTQLEKVLEIKSEVFEPISDLDKFLARHGLLKKWIDGRLIGCIGNLYYERSKSFGIRNKYNETKIVLNSFKLIWNLEKDFVGHSNEREGEFAKFYYRQEYRLINLEGKQCNEEWLQKIKKECGL